MPRPRKWRKVCTMPQCTSFGPHNKHSDKVIKMTIDEYEVIRLIDLENFTQEKCADKMEIARTTVQSIYAGARKKIAQGIIGGLTLVIEGGEYRICEHEDGCCGHGCCQNIFNQQDMPTL